MGPLTGTKFWQKKESVIEQALRERIEKLEGLVSALDTEATEMEQRLSTQIEELRKLVASGSIQGKAETESVPTGRPIFSQRRANAIARSSATQKMAEQIAKSAPKENQNG